MNRESKNSEFQITPLGDSAVTVTFGNIISEELNELVLSADAAVNAVRFGGFIETVPAYSSLAVFYDPLKITKDDDSVTAFETVCSLIVQAFRGMGPVNSDSRTIEIPVSFSSQDAPDLEELAAARGLTKEQVIEIFTSKTYRVYMLGFLPGFSYMGEVDERIATPRKESPRTRVPKGSVGIAGNQTGIYSLESPGGWQIIGRTDVEMFLPDDDPPAFLQPGDMVRFVAR